MKVRMVLPALVIVIAAATAWGGDYGLGLAFVVAAGFLALVAAMIPDAP